MVDGQVAWAKLFPEDTHEDGEEAEEGGESFPVLLAVKGPRSAQKTGGASHGGNSDDDNSSAASRTASLASTNSNSQSHTQEMQKGKSVPAMANVRAGWSFDAGSQQQGSVEGSDDGDEDEDAFDGDDGHGDDARVVDVDHLMDGAQGSVLFFNDNHSQYSTPSAEESRFHRPNLARGHVKGGFLSDMQPDFGGHSVQHNKSAHFNLHRPKVANHDSFVRSTQRAASIVQNTSSVSASALQNEGLIRKLTKRGSSMHLERSATVTAQALAAMALNKPLPAPAHIQYLARAVSSLDLHSTVPSAPHGLSGSHGTLPGTSAANLKAPLPSASAANLKAALPPVRAMSTLKEEKDREKEKPKSKSKDDTAVRADVISEYTMVLTHFSVTPVVPQVPLTRSPRASPLDSPRPQWALGPPPQACPPSRRPPGTPASTPCRG